MMSGTSVDGVDAALVEFKSANELSVVETEFSPFSKRLKQRINRLAQSNADLVTENIQALDSDLAEAYIAAIISLLKKSGYRARDVSAIANHGQTIRHRPDAKPPISLQLGDAQKLANRTGITTISQFRQADLELGGQGAPLMPAFHAAQFTDMDTIRYVLNIGGIANITRLSNPVIGFDTGPGNTLMDQWVKSSLGRPYDNNGDWAKSGSIIADVLDVLLQEPYFTREFPKSTGPDFLNLNWLQQMAGDLTAYPPQDIQATLLALSVETIGIAFEQIHAVHGEIYICGGGAHNLALIASLKNRLPGFAIKQTGALGVPADWVESVGFAWLGYCNLHNIPSNLPSVTGASEQTVLGQQYQATS